VTCLVVEEAAHIAASGLGALSGLAPNRRLLSCGCTLSYETCKRRLQAVPKGYLRRHLTVHTQHAVLHMPSVAFGGLDPGRYKQLINADLLEYASLPSFVPHPFTPRPELV
jgi:hypothetical protein